jgi:hypothetical protein
LPKVAASALSSPPGSAPECTFVVDIRLADAASACFDKHIDQRIPMEPARSAPRAGRPAAALRQRLPSNWPAATAPRRKPPLRLVAGCNRMVVMHPADDPPPGRVGVQPGPCPAETVDQPGPVTPLPAPLSSPVPMGVSQPNPCASAANPWRGDVPTTPPAPRPMPRRRDIPESNCLPRVYSPMDRFRLRPARRPRPAPPARPAGQPAVSRFDVLLTSPLSVPRS